VRIVSASVAFLVAAIPFVIGLVVIFWAGRRYYARRARRLAAAEANKPTPSTTT
jgi:membrane protein DedA with SNARE-associated domain